MYILTKNVPPAFAWVNIKVTFSHYYLMCEHLCLLCNSWMDEWILNCLPYWVDTQSKPVSLFVCLSISNQVSTLYLSNLRIICRAQFQTCSCQGHIYSLWFNVWKCVSVLYLLNQLKVTETFFEEISIVQRRFAKCKFKVC